MLAELQRLGQAFDNAEAEIEAVARALCWGNGMNPDLTLGGDGQNFLWMEYQGQAELAITALDEVRKNTT